MVDKDRSIADPIDALFRWREEALRAISPLFGDGSITQPQYVTLSALLSAVQSYFVNAAGANGTDSFRRWVDADAPAEPRALVTGVVALASRRFHIRNRLAAYEAQYGRLNGRPRAAFLRGITASQMESVIRNLVMNSVGVNLGAKEPRALVRDLAQNTDDYRTLLA